MYLDRFNLRSACIDLHIAIMRLSNLVDTVDSSSVDSLSSDMVSLTDSINSVCSKYYKK